MIITKSVGQSGYSGYSGAGSSGYSGISGESGWINSGVYDSATATPETIVELFNSLLGSLRSAWLIESPPP